MPHESPRAAASFLLFRPLLGTRVLHSSPKVRLHEAGILPSIGLFVSTLGLSPDVLFGHAVSNYRSARSLADDICTCGRGIYVVLSSNESICVDAGLWEMQMFYCMNSMSTAVVVDDV